MRLNKPGYGAMPRVEEKLAMSPEPASSLQSLTLLTSQIDSTTFFVGKAYAAAGQAEACLHTMAMLQAYQAKGT